MTSTKGAKPPKLIEGIDVRKLPIGPQEAFILSRVDGNASQADISQATGLDEDQVRQGLQRLAEIGAVEWEGMVARAREFAQTLPAFAAVQPPEPPPYDPKELEEQVDLTLEKKQRILTTYYRLEDLTHYQLLGVATDADKKAIKQSYYEVVNLFHPDRYFGKNLGSFKAKMEAVFARVTVAHDTLTRLKPRQEYDEYLESQLKTKRLDEMMLEQAPVNVVVQAKPPVDAIEEQPSQQAMAANAPAGDTGPSRSFRPSRPSMRRTSDPEMRRRALARKLRSATPGPRTSGTIPAVQVPPDKEALKQQVAAELKSRYGSQLGQGTAQQVDHYIQAADQAERDKDPVSAVNNLRIAAQLAPESEELAKRLAETQARAAAALADNYLEQAQYEQREGRLLKAAHSYERAALGKQSGALYIRAAECLLEEGSDLKRAADLAKKAVQLSPNQPDYHVTLSRVYAAAKMFTSATTEAERAAKLGPQSESAQKWLKSLKRGEI